jgi:L-2-hydroxyglutarate oxidase LhgO
VFEKLVQARAGRDYRANVFDKESPVVTDAPTLQREVKSLTERLLAEAKAREIAQRTVAENAVTIKKFEDDLGLEVEANQKNLIHCDSNCYSFE